ncbi:MAG: hypothetical protein HYU66_27870 [Armatimonadetes bacterium]|nr:hypothetical protein [Armatimonadota bacterium]
MRWTGVTEDAFAAGVGRVDVLLRVVYGENDSRDYWHARLELKDPLDEALAKEARIVFEGVLSGERAEPVRREVAGGQVWVDQHLTITGARVVGVQARPAGPPTVMPAQPAPRPGTFDPEELKRLAGETVQWRGSVDKYAGPGVRELLVLLLVDQRTEGQATEWRVRVRLSKPLPKAYRNGDIVLVEGLLDPQMDSRQRLLGLSVRTFNELKLLEARLIDEAAGG